jgi:hypothetical protein
MFFCLDQVTGNELLPIEPVAHEARLGRAGSTARNSARICAGSKGFVMKRDAPEESARPRELSSPRVVTTMMGTSLSASFLLSLACMISFL